MSKREKGEKTTEKIGKERNRERKMRIRCPGSIIINLVSILKKKN